MAYGHCCSFLSVKRYALSKEAEPVKVSAIIHIGTTNITSVTRIPKGL